MKGLAKGGKEAASVYNKITSETKSMSKAYSALKFVEDGLYKTEEERNEAYAVLGEYLGMSIENSEDFVAAQGLMTSATATTGAYLSAMIGQMIAVGAVQIGADG